MMFVLTDFRLFVQRNKLLLRYLGLVGVVLALGLAGICLGINCKGDPGWGGALGTAVAFGTLFARRDNGMAILNKSVCDADRLELEMQAGAFAEPEVGDLDAPMDSPAKTLTPQEIRLAGVIRAVRTNADGQLQQTRTLAVASVMGTLFWGFGQKLSDLLRGHLVREILFYSLLLSLYAAISASIVRQALNEQKKAGPLHTGLPPEDSGLM